MRIISRNILKFRNRSLKFKVSVPLIVAVLVLSMLWYNVNRVQALVENKYASSHITGSFSTPTNAVGSTTGTWSGDLNTSGSYTSRWAMEDPSATLTGTQTIEVLARKGSNSGTPTIAVNLYENGSLVQSIAGATNITSTTGQTVSGTFSAAAVTNANNVEIEVVEVGAGGSPSARNSAQIDYIHWNANLTDTVTVGTQNSHFTNLSIPTTDGEVGGSFTLIRNSGSANVTSIKIHESGTVDAQNNLSNVKLFYKTEAVCSTTMPAGTTQFNSTPGSFNASNDSTMTGTIAVSTSKICIYTTLDVGSGAANGETIVLGIANPSTDVAVSTGTSTPATSIFINGSVTLTSGATGPTVDQCMRHCNWYNNGSEQGFHWAD